MYADAFNTPQGKGLRPWRLTAENPDFFHPATLLRLIEDKRREKILKASGTSTTTGGANHQAPIANLGTKRTGERGRRSGGEGARVASPPSAEGFGGNPRARDSPGSSTASEYVESCSYGFGGMGGGEERGAAGRGGDGVYSRGPSLDIEIDVRKRILELVSWLSKRHAGFTARHISCSKGWIPLEWRMDRQERSSCAFRLKSGSTSGICREHERANPVRSIE